MPSSALAASISLGAASARIPLPGVHGWMGGRRGSPAKTSPDGERGQATRTTSVAKGGRGADAARAWSGGRDAEVGRKMTAEAGAGRGQSAGWVTMLVYWTAAMTGQVLLMTIGLTLPGMMADLDFGSVQAGTLSGIGWMGTALLSIPLNAWVSRYPPKRTLAVAMAALALAYLANALAPNYWALLAARCIGVLVVMCGGTGIVLLQYQWFSPRQMSAVKGIELGFSSTGQSLALAGVPVAMALWGGWRGAYLATAALLAPLVAAWLLLARDNPTPGYLARMAAQKAAGSPTLQALKHREFVLLGVGAAGYVGAKVAFMTFWPQYALKELGLPLEASALVLGTVPLAGVPAALLAGTISNKLGLRKPLLMLAGLMLMLGYSGLLQLRAIEALSLTAGLAGFSGYLFLTLAFTMAFELPGIRPQEVAVGTGVILALLNLGGALGAQAAGIMIESMGLGGALSVLCMTPLLLTISAAFCRETGPRANRAALTAAQGPSSG